jgi:hypothetical protein
MAKLREGGGHIAHPLFLTFIKFYLWIYRIMQDNNYEGGFTEERNTLIIMNG